MPTASNQSYQSPWGNGWNNNPGWSGPPIWHPAGLGRPLIIAGIVFLVVAGHVGRMLFWPLAVAGIVFMMVSGRGCRRRWGQNQWNQSAPNQDQNGNSAGNGWQSCMPPWGRLWNFGGGNGGGNQQPPSSGNHAFDEYRSETLRRLEDEQKDFASFLERLRFAKDKAEFDQFMADRRRAPPAPPAPEQPPAG